MSNYALIKDGVVVNTVVWDGPDAAPINWGDGITYVLLDDTSRAQIGCTYADDLFTCTFTNPMTNESYTYTTKATDN